MAFLPRPVRPTRAFADLRDFIGQRRKHELVFAALSVAMTLVIVLAMVKQFESKREWQPPEITYVKEWPTSRTRLDIQQQQARDLPGELARQRALEKAQAERRAQFQRVADSMGIDTGKK